MMNRLLMSVLSQKNSKPKEGNYVRFVSAESRTITPKYTNSGVTLQYSVNRGETWTTIASGSETTSATEHWFRGRATGTKSLFIKADSTNAWAFSDSSDLEVYGNLNFLLCDTLGDEVAPTSLANYCYSRMFEGCTSLTTAPELPATTVGNDCYYRMFSGCTSLTTAPSILPATTLAKYCYSSMFSGCTSLTTAPEVHATTLAEYCYSTMFSGCTSLTTAPELPAITLAKSCYSSMFYGCTSLTIAPELPAITVAEYCYFHMFSGCTSLTTAPELPATTLAWADDCYSHMFEGCTSLTTPPELPATKLANYCYAWMFSGCTSFKVSKTKTGSYVYSWRIPTLGTGTTSLNWNYDMLENTGGTTSDPTINGTYYVENQPVVSNANGFYVTVRFNRNGVDDSLHYKINEETIYTEIQGYYGKSIIIPNVTQITCYATSNAMSSLHLNIIGNYTISGDYHIPYGHININIDPPPSCFIEGSQISLENGLTKNIEDITYDDELLAWNFDEGKFDIAKPLWIQKQKQSLEYNHLVFSDGSELNTVNQHRIFNVEKGMFTYPMTDDTPIGTTTFNDKGEYITLVSKEIINEEVEYYNIITDYHINLFANSILTSCRLSNLYPIENMQYVKDNRELHNPEIFNELDDKWVSGLRLLEQPLEINRDNAVMFENSLVDYVKRLERNMKDDK